MIYFLKGTLTSYTEDSVIVDVNGVGYQVFVPQGTTLPPVDQPVTLYTFQYVREDQLTLYGFAQEELRQVFITLTGLSGIGPKLAIKILSSITPVALTKAILSQDLATLTSISGVGKKMAERIIIELKDKVEKLQLGGGMDLSDIDLPKPSLSLDKTLEADLTMALKTLGYHQDEIKRALKQAGDQLDPSQSLESCMKVLLKSL